MQQPFLGSKIVWVTFLTLMGAFGLNLTAGQFFSPLNDTYGWGLPILSLAVSVNMITWGIFQPIMGRLIDRFGPKSVIAGSASLMGFAFLLSATITEVWQFFLYYGILTAIGFAGCGSMANSVLVSRWYVKKRAKMLTRSSMGMNIGQLVLLPLTGFLIANSGFRTAFVVLGLIMLIIVVPIVLFVVKNNPNDVGQMPDGDTTSVFTATKSASLTEALQSREFWIATLGFATCGFTLYFVTMHLPNFSVDLGGGKSLGGQLLGIAALASAVSMWITGQLTRVMGKKNLLVILYIIRFSAFMWLAVSPGIWQLYVFAVVYGSSSMPIIPLVTGMIGDRFGKNAMGSILGFSWFIHQAFAALGVFLGGYLRSVTGDYTSGFWMGAFLLAFGAVLTTMMKEHSVHSDHQRVVQ
ncbi:MFS transporter [Melghirimyces algeriensis]|uniref:Predicted arabinose efflux permease, MFS family n=1 Tax=Melghirimyces algeriensis TaxID=910412 RepID=A0A521EY49_9BACL|nr:MFS transporter [Melghirimyces algeriensis]SMO88361.1 Predicted arabinose efflux permease, MFS family [Melghirimyces algeriensis]